MPAEQLQRANEDATERERTYAALLEGLREEFSQARAGYEVQIERLTAELAQLTGELSGGRARRSEMERQVADTRTQLEQQAVAYAAAQAQLVQQNAALIEVHSQLLKKDEILSWVHTSRSWKLITSLRLQYHRLGVSVSRLLRRLKVPVSETFQGTIESPAPDATCSKYIDVSGWVASATGRVTLVEAFLDGFFLGAVRYSSDRPDIAATLPSRARGVYGYAERLTLYNAPAGQKTLTIRAFDQHGHSHLFGRTITVTPADASAQEAAILNVPAAAVGSYAPAAAAESAESAPPKVLEREEVVAAVRVGFLTQLEEIVGEFENRMNRAPFILDWDTGLQISEVFPHLAIMSPCASNGNGHLPYLDHTVDIVMLPSLSGDRVAEARRVAAAVMVQVDGLRSRRKDQPTAPRDKSRVRLRAEWRDDKAAEAQLPTASIVVPVYNKVEYTKNCLAQLQNTLPLNFRGEVIVIDDASADRTPRVLQEFAKRDPRFKVLRNEQNLGFIRSCNRAAAEAAGEVIVFLNNDTLPQPGWLPPLLKVLQDYPNAGAVGGKLIYPDGTLQEAGGVIFSDATGCNFGKHDRSASAPLYNFMREVDYCSGALLATRRELFHRLGGFDLRYAPAYYEDTDYCFALREKGYHVYYQPESVIIHFEGVTSGTDVNSGVKKYQEVNRAKFREKWQHFLQHHPAPPRQYDFATLHELSVRSWPRVEHEN
jgi:GT2 family glycosyltransferase